MSTTVASEKRHQAKVASDALAAVTGVKGVCVFGSVARGRADVGSDIDLLVLGTDERLTSSMLLRQLPAELRVARISIVYAHCGQLGPLSAPDGRGSVLISGRRAGFSMTRVENCGGRLLRTYR